MNLPAKKSLGQHWLEDEQILAQICEIAGVYTDDEVLEIGPGHGTLTKKLLENGAKVTAVELDNELAQKLQATISNKNFSVVNQDILEFNLTTLPKGYKVVANIPYYLTSKLIRVLSESANPPKQITLLVQKEVAERICAKPGEMSVLSISAQIYYDCILGIVVPAEKFTPPPKVDSQIVNMLRKTNLLVKESNEKQFFRIVKAGFSSRRKTILNSLSGGLNLSKEEITSKLEQAKLNPGQRAQELSLEDWHRLYKYLTS